MYAIASLLYSPDYLPGALVLGHTLRKTPLHGAHLVLLCCTYKFTKSQLDILRSVYDEIIDIDLVTSRISTNLHLLNRSNLANTFSKIHLWGLPYDKVLYLDCDTLPLIHGQGSVTDLLLLDFALNHIVAAPDSGFPDIFNSGAFVIHPNPQDYHRLSELAALQSPDVSFDGADQGLLNQYFNSDPDWVQHTVHGTEHSNSWVKIPFLYNSTPNKQYEYFPAFRYFHAGSADSQIKLVHFIGATKPWNSGSEGLFADWWLRWNEFSGGKSIKDALFPDTCILRINPLVVPGEDPSSEECFLNVADDAPTTLDNCQRLDYYETEANPTDTFDSAFTPADLCDPMNYQDWPSTPAVNALYWDPAEGPPPTSQPHYSDFDQDMKLFHVGWNSEPSSENFAINDMPQQTPTCTSPDIAASPPSLLELAAITDSGVSLQADVPLASRTSEPVGQTAFSPGLSEIAQQFEHVKRSEPLQLDSGKVEESAASLGVHKDQAPERVFADSSDVHLQHVLLKRPSDHALPPEVLADALAEIELQDEASSDDPEEVADEDGLEEDLEDGSEEDVPKVFPWEFRDPIEPERVFE